MATNKNVSAVPFLLIVMSGFVMAGMDSAAKYLVTGGVPVLLVIWARYLFQTCITLGVLSIRTGSLRFLVAKRPGLQLCRATALFFATLMFYSALKYISLADATAIIFLAPVMVTALSAVVLKEKVGLHRWVAVVVAFAGVMVVVRPGSGVFGYAALLPLGGAVLTCLFIVMTRLVGYQDSPSTTAFYTTAVGAVALSCIAGFIWVPLTLANWGVMVLAGVLGALGHGLLVLAYRAEEASALAPFTYTQLLAAIFWGYVVFSDVPSMPTFVGAAMIAGGGVYVWYRESVEKSRVV